MRNLFQSAKIVCVSAGAIALFTGVDARAQSPFAQQPVAPKDGPSDENTAFLVVQLDLSNPAATKVAADKPQWKCATDGSRGIMYVPGKGEIEFRADNAGAGVQARMVDLQQPLNALIQGNLVGVMDTAGKFTPVKDKDVQQSAMTAYNAVHGECTKHNGDIFKLVQRNPFGVEQNLSVVIQDQQNPAVGVGIVVMHISAFNWSFATPQPSAPAPAVPAPVAPQPLVAPPAIAAPR